MLEYMSKNRPNPHSRVFSRKKLLNFVIGKFSDFSYPEHFKRYIQHFSVRTRNNLDKIWSSFGEMSEKDIFNTKKKCNIFITKISDFSNLKNFIRCLQNSSLGTRNSQEKISCRFGDISEKIVFFVLGKKSCVLFQSGTF